MDDVVINTTNLTYYYGKHMGIRDVNLRVRKGEVFGFLGPNGAGKTTTLRLLLDVLRPTGGSASIFGLDCQKQGTSIRQNLGYLPGEFSLYPNMKAHSFLAMVASLKGNSVDKKYLEQLYQRLSFDPSKKMKAYSRGNKQKIGIIAAFMNRPDLLVLDEPTAGLDPLMQHIVTELVHEAKQAGKTVFFSSHILPEVQAVCDRVGIIRHGHLIKTDTIGSLTRQHFKRLRLRFSSLPETGGLSGEGVKETERKDRWVTFEISGNMKEFMHKAATFGIEDIQSLPVTLDEIFVSLYTDQPPAKDRRESNA